MHYDPDAFGQFSESIARYLGTARFLVYQTGVIVAWVGLNLLPPADWQFDPWGRGLVLLTLVLSLQASYAAPLILLAQNRQEQRDRTPVSYTHLRAHETVLDLVCRLLLEKKNKYLNDSTTLHTYQQVLKS